MAVIQIKRGLQEAVTNLVLAQGELAVALDTGNVYIGATSGNVHIPRAAPPTRRQSCPPHVRSLSPAMSAPLRYSLTEHRTWSWCWPLPTSPP